jgi:O-antigen/teichoic acid export membrane protein/O-antigen ligase
VHVVGSTMGARLAASFLSFGVGVITARVLGPHERGQLAVLIAVPAVCSVAGIFGLDTANLRFSGESDAAYRRVVRWCLLFSVLAGTCIPAAWWLAGRFWPPVLLGLDPRLALVAAAICPLAVALTLLGTAAVGRGSIRLYNVVTAATMATYLAGTVALLLGHHLTVAWCGCVYGISQLAGAALLLGLAGRHASGGGQPVSSRTYRRYAIRAYLPNLAQYGMLRMDVPLIQLLAGTTAVALYAVALPIAEGLLLLPLAIALVMFPAVTGGTVNGRAASRIAQAVLATTAGLAVIAALAAPVAIPMIYGSAFHGSVAALWVMLPGIVAFGAARSIQTYLAGTDRMRPVIVASLAGIATGIAGLLLLVPLYGAVGAGAADSLGYLAFALVIVGMLRPGGQLVAAVIQWLGRLWHPFSGTALVAVISLGAAFMSVSGRVTLLSTAAALTLVAIVVMPRASLFLVAIAIPVSQTSFGAALLPGRAFSVLLVACFAGHLFSGRVGRPRTPILILVVALLSYLLLSSILSTSGAGSSQGLTNVVELGAPLLCLLLITEDEPLARQVLTVFAVVTACLAVAQIPTTRSSLTASAGNTAVAASQTGSVNHNAEGALFVIAMCVLLAQLPRARTMLTRAALAVTLLGLIIGTEYSLSRSAYFGTLAVFVVFALRRSLRGLAVTVVAAACLVTVLPAAVLARVSTLWNSNGLDTSSAVRLDLWTAALHMFAKQPLFGVGYLNFSSQLPIYYTDSGNYAVSQLQFASLYFAHNTYLTILAETGVVGAILVGVLITLAWRRAWSATRPGLEKASWTGECAVLAFAGVGTCSVFGEPLLVPAVLAGFLLPIMAVRASTTGGRRPAPASEVNDRA